MKFRTSAADNWRKLKEEIDCRGDLSCLLEGSERNLLARIGGTGLAVERSKDPLVVVVESVIGNERVTPAAA